MGAQAEDLEATIPGVPRAGERIDGKYEVETLIGEGAMGFVFVAKHLKLGERVAIKVLKPDVVKNAPTLVQRFLREARAAITIQSAHVVRVMDVATLESGAPFMVMEYLEGDDLQTLLQKEGALPIDRAVEYLLQACDALAEAHARGIVHRDLKPANLFLTTRFDGTPWIKVLDFGISKAIDRDAVDPEVSLTQTAAILGSPAYMSPEQVRNAKTVDGRADIWSLGVILYKLLLAEAPFEGGTFSSLCAAIVADDPPRLCDKRPEIPSALEAIVLRCLEKKPERRFQKVEDLAEALRACRSPVAPVVATQRRPLPTWSWIALGLCAAIGAAVLAFPRQPAPPVVPAVSAPAAPSVVASPSPPPPAVTTTSAPPAPPLASPSSIKPKLAPKPATSPSVSALQVAPPKGAPSAPDPLEHAQ